MARRNFRPRANPLDTLTNGELVQRYRMDREGILFVQNLIEHDIQPRTGRSNSVTALQKVLTTLQYFATGNLQITDGDLHGFSQPTISRIIRDVSTAMSNPRVTSRFIRFPTTRQEMETHKLNFYGIGAFPNVIGVIDGTQIQIQAPSKNKEEFINRMNYHSINTQVVFDSDSKIIDLVARWPGSTHDSRILRESGLKILVEGHLPPGNHYILGDSGYPCKRWLMTPYLHPQPGPQTAYNRAHKTTHALVERGIGQWKRRWGVLHGEIRMCPEKAARVILCCGVLHNICKNRGIPMQDNDDNDVGEQLVHDPINNNGPQDGLRHRDFVANTHF